MEREGGLTNDRLIQSRQKEHQHQRRHDETHIVFWDRSFIFIGFHPSLFCLVVAFAVLVQESVVVDRR